MEKTLKGGFWLFLDGMVGAFVGWIFWLVVSILTTPTDVGYAASTVSLVGVAGVLLTLGLDYSLLRDVGSGRERVYGSLAIVEVGIAAATLPLIFLSGLIFFGEAFYDYMALGLVMVVAFSLSFISRFALLGIIESKLVFWYDLLGVVIRLIVGVFLVLLGYGGWGIMVALVAERTFTAIALTLTAVWRIGFSWGGFTFVKGLVKLGLANLLGRISTTMVTSLSVVFFTVFTNDPSFIGVFYIALAIIMALGMLGTSLATMALPSSMTGEVEIFSSSLRIGLYFSIPFIAALLSAPSWILSFIGEAYIAGGAMLTILALSIIPNIFIVNSVSRFNRHRDTKTLLLVGMGQLSSLIAATIILMNIFGNLGAPAAVLTSSVIASAICIWKVGKEVLKHLATSISVMIIGGILGVSLSTYSEPVGVAAGLVASATLLFATKSLTFKEISFIVKTIRS